MSWPLASHFSAMLQNPHVAFRDPLLQQCVIEKDEQNQPRPWSGAFAVVYKAVDPQRQPRAVRVFTTESPERRERYEQVSAYFKGRKLNCLVDFEYRDRSIRAADGKWYPLIVMEWVQGETLFKWVRARCLQGDRAALMRAAERWVEVVKELGQSTVTHGDLQHANVMVTTAGELKLVDYDCMCVPALIGRRNLEVGVEPYQHPTRNARTLLSLDLDNFSALVIYVALRALAVDTQLWTRYVEQPGYDKLLFRLDDFHSPGVSPLYGDLMRLPDHEVVELTQHLFNFVRMPMDQVPPLGQLANAYAKIEHLLVTRQWDTAVKLLNRRGSFRDAPDYLKLLIRQAYEHVCRQEAWAKFAKIPDEANETRDRELVGAWNEGVLAGYEPAEQQRLRVAEARRRVTLLDRLNHQVQSASRVITLPGERNIVEAARPLPEGYQHSLAARVAEARRRVMVVDRLAQAISKPAPEAMIVGAWRAVIEAKCEVLIDPEWKPRIELAEKRAALLRSLAAVPTDLPPPDRDQQLLTLWQEELLADCPDADRFRAQQQLAIQRRVTIDEIKAAIESGNDEERTRLLAEPCLAGYPLPDGLAPKKKRWFFSLRR